jgi:hypothetical protein
VRVFTGIVRPRHFLIFGGTVLVTIGAASGLPLVHNRAVLSADAVRMAAAIRREHRTLTALVTSLGRQQSGGTPDIIGRPHQGNERLQFDQWRLGPRMRLRKEINGRPRRAIDCPPSRSSVRPHHLQHISTITFLHYRSSTRFCRRDTITAALAPWGSFFTPKRGRWFRGGLAEEELPRSRA